MVTFKIELTENGTCWVILFRRWTAPRGEKGKEGWEMNLIKIGPIIAWIKRKETWLGGTEQRELYFERIDLSKESWETVALNWGKLEKFLGIFEDFNLNAFKTVPNRILIKEGVRPGTF